MKKWLKDNDEFYIGYLPDAPHATANILRKTIFSLGLLMVIIAIILVCFQKKFSDSNFDYGHYTNIKGFVYTEPVPHIIMAQNEGNQKTILAVGYGKHGADERLKQLTGSVNGVYGEITGQLIEGNGKMILQVDEESTFTKLNHANHETMPSSVSLGNKSFTGEVVDPKCYFGVMKPGEGKPHRSCAIRCIAGGIPPVFHSEDSYYVLLSPELKPVNELVLGFVSDRVTLSGEVLEFGDWKFLLVHENHLKKISTQFQLNRNLVAMQTDMTFCKN